MILDPQDFADFLRLHSQLMSFVLKQSKTLANKISSEEDYIDLALERRLPVNRAFRKDGPALIDAYLKSNPNGLEGEDLETVKSWKQAVHGDFIVLRHLKNYTVFLDDRSPTKVFAVLGLSQPVSELVVETPSSVETTLLPFRGRIVYDGIIANRNVSFGPGIKRSLNESYRLAKKSPGLITSLTPAPENKTVSRKKPAGKVTAAQRIKRLVTSLHKKMAEVREMTQTLKHFEEDIEPAFHCWIKDTFGKKKKIIEDLEAEVEDLENLVYDARDAWDSGEFKSGADAINAAREELELDRMDDEESDFGDGEDDSDQGLDSKDIPDSLLEEMFASFMHDMRGIEVDGLNDEEYAKAWDQFNDSINHAKQGNKSAFEKSLYRTGADESEANVSAVKKTFRNLARKIHPDRNPDFGEEAQEIWNELKAAKEALDLKCMEQLDTRWRVIQKDTFTPKEEKNLKELQRSLQSQMIELQWVFRKAKSHPMWGSSSKVPPAALKKKLAKKLSSEIASLELEKAHFLSQIEHIKSFKSAKAPAKKLVKKQAMNSLAAEVTRVVKEKAAAEKRANQIKPTHEQMSFDF